MSLSKENVHSSRKFPIFYLGDAPEVVGRKFQDFCSNFDKLTDAVNSLLEMDNDLVNKYRFLPLPDDTPIHVQSTSLDDPQEVREAMIKLNKYAKKGKYKSVSNAIEELLMSYPRSNDPSVVEANNSSEFTIDSEVKQSLEIVVEEVYNKLIENINLKHQREDNKLFNQSSSIVSQNYGEHQIPVINSRPSVPVRSIQKNTVIPNKPATSVWKSGQIKIIPYATIAKKPAMERPVLISGNINNNKVLKRSYVESSQERQSKAKLQKLDLTVEQPKESKAIEKEPIEIVSLLDEEENAPLKLGIKQAVAKPLLNTLFSHLENKDQPENRQEELTELIVEDVKGDEMKNLLLEDCALVSKCVVDKYQEKYKNKFRN